MDVSESFFRRSLFNVFFLAAMSSSRSDVVTQFVRPLVRHQGVFFSLRSYKGVSRSLMCVSMKYQGCFMQVSLIGSFKVVSRKFQGCFEGVSRVFQRSSDDYSSKF